MRKENPETHDLGITRRSPVTFLMLNCAVLQKPVPVAGPGSVAEGGLTTGEGQADISTSLSLGPDSDDSDREKHDDSDSDGQRCCFKRLELC